METPRETDNTNNLSALAWVHEELRKSLESAHKALRQFLKAAEAVAGSDVDAVDPALLRTARLQIHQSVGALELVGLPAGATLLRASEAAIQRFVAKPHLVQAASVDAIEKASFALLDYIGRLMAGKSVSAVALFPQYEAVQMVAGAERIHPADLWPLDWQWRDLGSPTSVHGRQADAQAMGEFEQLLLRTMRQPTPESGKQLASLCAALAAGGQDLPQRTLWQLASAFFEGQASGVISPDLYTKRSASKLFAQLRSQARGGHEAPQRLAQDLLFFVAQASPEQADEQTLPFNKIRQLYDIPTAAPVNYRTTSLGRFDPAWIAVARKRVASAKDAWNAVAAGELHRLSGLAEQFSLVGESLQRLYPRGERLATALHATIAQTVTAGAAPAPALAMEVATSVLYLEASLEDGDFDDPQEAQHVLRLAQRLDSVRAGNVPEPLDAWMEELYRRVSDRQTMGSVVHELASNLAEAEKMIDQFFRKTDDRNVLIPVPAQLQAMRGVLSVLGMDQASSAVLRMRDDVDTLLMPSTDIQHASDQGVFERLAINLGALGFLIDMLNVQPQLVKSLFRFDAATGVLSPLMGRRVDVQTSMMHLTDAPQLLVQAQSVVEAAQHEAPLADLSRDLELLSLHDTVAQEPTLAATILAAQSAVESAEQAGAGPATQRLAREQVVQAMDDFMVTMSGPMDLDLLLDAPAEPGHSRSGPLSSPAPLTLQDAAVPEPVATGLEEDDEMRDIFLEEAREVIEAGLDALRRLASAPESIEDMTTLRRAFHTLKGSSRMVGLSEFGEAAWACEQLYNAWLAEQKPADEALRGMSLEALNEFARWANDIAQHRPDQHRGPPIQKAADGLRLEGKWGPRLPLADNAETVSGQVISPAPYVNAPAPANAAPLVAQAPPPQEDEAGQLPTQAVELTPEPLAAQDTLRAPLDESVPTAVVAQSLPQAEPGPGAPPPEPVLEPETEQEKIIGPLRISIPLFNIYLNEADEHSRRLSTELAEWAHAYQHHPDSALIGDSVVALAHSLAGSSATVGFADLSQLARLLEHGLMRAQDLGAADNEVPHLFVDAAEEIRRLLHQFAAGFLKAPNPELLERLDLYERDSAKRLEEQSRNTDFRHTPFEDTSQAEWPEPLDLPLMPSQPVFADTGPAPARPSGLMDLGQPEVKPLPAIDAEQAARAQVITLSAQTHVAGGTQFDGEIDAVDAVDADLFPIFEEEARDLLPQLSNQLREWSHHLMDFNAASSCMRTLHTLKGGARLAGAMRMGEMAHRMESVIEHLVAKEFVGPDDLSALEARCDALMIVFEALSQRDAQAYAQASAAAAQAALQDTLPAPLEDTASRDLAPTLPTPQPVAPDPKAQTEPSFADAATPPLGAQESANDESLSKAPVAPPAGATHAFSAAEPVLPLNWARFELTAPAQAVAQLTARVNAPGAGSAVRVRPQLLDRLVNHAGEVMITRTRLASEVGHIKSSLGDLTENLERLRLQLRDIELQAETQMSSRLEAARASTGQFDPLEFDRYTRFQELTRMMAESVNDVATVQRSLQRTLETTEDQLATQARLTRDMQDDLLRTRMVEFESLSDRLYRVVRLAAKETGKQVQLDIVGGSVELDRGVLDRMTGAFEHLLRNCVAHGIESPEVRKSLGKDATGVITVTLHQEGNEVGVEFRDDGAGLNLARIREKGQQLGLLDAQTPASDAELANLIFAPGFSTAETVSELSGRGIGMDVVRSEINNMGGRIETATTAGLGTSFKLVMPLTTAVTRVVMLRCGPLNVAVPTHLVEIVRRSARAELDACYASGTYSFGDTSMPFFWLGALLQSTPVGLEAGRTLPIVVIRSAQQRVALHVDEVLGNQEVVVKNLGPQLSRLPGLAGMTLLASGAVALIYNPVALATVYGESAQAYTRTALEAAQAQHLAASHGVAASQAVPAAHLAPLVLVVDDSLTVRRVTQRLLAREGYRVTLAKDGLDALEQLAQELPTVVLSDIEMPRMDGFDLVRNIRADARLAPLPVIMITSRIAQKHRDYANELGVNHYLGKPYSEEELLGLIHRYCQESAKVLPSA